MQGVVPFLDARRMAEDQGLDLVEISPGADPPVCKIMDFGKFKYEQQKKLADARKRQHVVETKEIKFGANIDDHDYGIKMRRMREFLGDGDKVKVTLRFRGREITHSELGMAVFERIQVDLSNLVKVEQPPRLAMKQLVMILAPR